MFPSRKKALFLLMLTHWLLLASCVFSPTLVSRGEDPEEAFRRLIGVPLNTCLHLFTNKAVYRREESAVYWVKNDCGAPIGFPDQSLALRVYWYDSERGYWLPIDPGFRVSEPRSVWIAPALTPEPQYVYGLEGSYIPEPLLGERIRLLVRAVLDNGDITFPIYGAYCDVVFLP